MPISTRLRRGLGDFWSSFSFVFLGQYIREKSSIKVRKDEREMLVPSGPYHINFHLLEPLQKDKMIKASSFFLLLYSITELSTL